MEEARYSGEIHHRLSEMSSVFGVDQDGSPLDFGSTFNIDHEHQFSQELQLSGTAVGERLKWLLGGST